MSSLRQLLRRLALSETARDRLARIAAELLVAVIVVCVVIVILALMKQGPSIPRTNPTTRLPATTRPTDWPTVVYQNCDEARKDGRSNIPTGDPAYSPRLDKNHDGIACESRNR